MDWCTKYIYYLERNSVTIARQIDYVFKQLWDKVILRYYATFKVRKFESLFYKINTCLQKTTTYNILSKYIIYIFFNFGHGFCGSFPMLFSKAPASCCKKVLN